MLCIYTQTCTCWSSGNSKLGNKVYDPLDGWLTLVDHQSVGEWKEERLKEVLHVLVLLIEGLQLPEKLLVVVKAALGVVENLNDAFFHCHGTLTANMQVLSLKRTWCVYVVVSARAEQISRQNWRHVHIT